MTTNKAEWYDDADDDFDEEAEAESRYGITFSDLSRMPARPPEDESPPAAESDQPPQPENDIGVKLDGFDDIFSVKIASQWIEDAATRPVQKQLFGEFWNEFELSILFADTGKGKSILATQIAESIASGVPIPPLAMTAGPQKVLLFDFEMDDQQFEWRYSAPDPADPQKRLHYKFSDNLIRIKLCPAPNVPAPFKSFSDYLVSSMYEFIEYSKAGVVIIDNITWLGCSTDTTSSVLALMKKLKQIKNRLGVSILVLAHTPKRYRHSPLTINDLQGSKMYANFADSIFALGESRISPDRRYLIQLKVRNAALTHDESNVCTLRLKKMPSIAPQPETPSLFRAKSQSLPPSLPGSLRPATKTKKTSKQSSPSYTVAGLPQHWPAPRPERGVAGRGGSFSPVESTADCQPPTANCFLGAEFLGCDHERTHIGWFGIQSTGRRLDLIKEARSMAAKNKTQKEIATSLNLSHATVSRYLNQT